MFNVDVGRGVGGRDGFQVIENVHTPLYPTPPPVPGIGFKTVLQPYPPTLFLWRLFVVFMASVVSLSLPRSFLFPSVLLLRFFFLLLFFPYFNKIVN